MTKRKLWNSSRVERTPKSRKTEFIIQFRDFKYLDTTFSTKNDWAKEIDIRINNAQKLFCALMKFLRSKMRRTKIRLYVAILRPTLAYSCEDRKTTKQTGRSLRTLANIFWRKICGLTTDEATGNWWIRYNRVLYNVMELTPITSYVKDLTKIVGRHDEERRKPYNKGRNGMEISREKI